MRRPGSRDGSNVSPNRQWVCNHHNFIATGLRETFNFRFKKLNGSHSIKGPLMLNVKPIVRYVPIKLN